ncbi:MAG: hypothetical protein MUF81_05450 [Verrucomicrobia bacterium]|nr:hypothetical protein [Verrucomicrobiota bacterium]
MERLKDGMATNARKDPGNSSCNSFGNLSRIQPDTGKDVKFSYRYDLLNRLTYVLDRFTNNTAYTFDGAGNFQTARYPNLVTNACGYNALNPLTNVSVITASGAIASFADTLAAAGNRTNLNEIINGASRTNQWQCDPCYRLTNEVISGSAPAGSISYKYDTVGNRTNRTSSASGVTNQTFVFNSNDQPTNDVFDSTGHTRTNNGNAFFYDVENRLTNAVVGGTNIIIVYDGDGNRVKKIVGSTTNLYLVDDRNPTGYTQVLEEKSVSGGTTNLVRLYTYGFDLISQRDARRERLRCRSVFGAAPSLSLLDSQPGKLSRKALPSSNTFQQQACLRGIGREIL